MTGWFLAVVGALGSGATGVAVVQAVTDGDRLDGLIGTAMFAAVTLGCLGGAWLLLRRRGTPRQPTLGWEPEPGEGWLPPRAWAEFPDVLPSRPRLGLRPPTPIGGVPPDGVLRRLWLVRAELAFDQAGGMHGGSFMGWSAMFALSLSLLLLLGAFFATGDLTVEDRALLGPLLAWLVVTTVLCGERASRNPWRHFRLRRLQRQLQTAYGATPRRIPAGPTVRFGDPTPHYDPGRLTDPAKETAGVPGSQEADRDLVQQTLSREWGEPTVAVYIEQFAPRFRVPGRRADGSSSSRYRVRRYVGLVGKTLHLVVVLAAELLSSATSLEGPSFATFSGQVRGPEGSAAVQFAAAVRSGEFWLATSASRLAAVKTRSSPPVIVMWSGAGSGCPQLDRDAKALRWPDGSSVSFMLDTPERQRLSATV
ncbi:MAG: hypothetical protein ACRDRW_10750 [Pseudonocardiaceae bacterium]